MKRLLTGLAFLLALAGHVEAHQVNFSWTAPSMYNDGVTALPLSAITNFEIYETDTPVPGSPNGQLIATVSGPPTSAAVTYTFNSTTITPGSHTFVVVTSTSNGSLSAPSNVLTLTIPNLAAAPITNFAGTAVN